MNAYVYPIKVNGQEILIAHDDKLVTWLNATDLVVRAGLYWFIEKHPEAGIMDLLNFCMEQEFECGCDIIKKQNPPSKSYKTKILFPATT